MITSTENTTGVVFLNINNIYSNGDGSRGYISFSVTIIICYFTNNRGFLHDNKGAAWNVIVNKTFPH